MEQLQAKFGAVDDSFLVRLESADGPTLRRYGRRILKVDSIEDVFAD
jgi:hypothetical protein